MKFAIRLLVLCGMLLTFGGCQRAPAIAESSAPTNESPDADAVELAALGEKAAEIAQTEAAEVALREVFTDLEGVAFLFTDPEAAKVIYVHVPDTNAPMDQWTVRTDTISQFIGRPDRGFDLRTLTIGPRR